MKIIFTTIQDNGIGLSIVYHVMELIDGKIEVESELGKVSFFLYKLV